jgi:hypothetical protein
MNSSNWSNFIKTHKLSTQITWSNDVHNISNILQPSQTILDPNDKAIRLINLSSFPSLIIITLNPFDHSLFPSFHHDHLPDHSDSAPTTHQLIALSGFSETANPILINTDDAFSSTDTLHATPSFQDLLSTHNQSLDTLKNIPSIENNTHSIRKAIIIPPFLHHLILDTPNPLNPWTLLHSIIQEIWKYGNSLHRPLIIIDENETVPDDTTNDTDEADAPTPPPVIDWSFADHLLPTLLSLWAFAHHDSIPDLTTKHTSALSPAAATWSAIQHETWYKTIDPTPTQSNHLLRTPPRKRFHSDDDDSTASSISKLQDTLDAQARRFAKEDNTDTSSNKNNKMDATHKSWTAIDETFRQAILFASSSDGVTAPIDPAERLLRIMQTKTGPTAAALIQRWHNPTLDLCIQPGMALHIIKGQLTSTPTAFTIDTFSPFFCPPTRVGFATISNKELNEFELVAKSLNFTTHDIKKMTACKPYIPTTAYIYIAQVRNFDAIISDILSTTCFIRSITTTLTIQHYEMNQLMYHNIFSEHQHFGVWMLNRLHFKVQSILHQCYQVDSVTDVDFMKYSMQPELHQIDTLSFIADPPQWHKDELALIRAKAEKDKRDRNTPWHELDDIKRSRRQRAAFDKDQRESNDKQRVKVTNDDMNPSFRLQNGEVYSKLIHFQNLTDCKNEAVKFKGDYICNNYQLRGFCHEGCKRSQSHTKLPPNVAAQYLYYINALRKSRDSFENRRHQRSNNENQRRTPNDRQGENDHCRS